MIKIRVEKKLLYVLAEFMFSYARQVVCLLIDYIYGFDLPLVYLLLMNFGQIIGGASIYIYQTRTLNKNKEVEYFGIQLIHTEFKMKQKDKCYKIILLIFFAAFFDFNEFIIIYFYLSKFEKVPSTQDSRLGCFSIISSSFILTFALKFGLGRHHKLSLITLGICLILTILLELLYESANTSIGNFFFAYFLTIFFKLILIYYLLIYIIL